MDYSAEEGRFPDLAPDITQGFGMAFLDGEVDRAYIFGRVYELAPLLRTVDTLSSALDEILARPQAPGTGGTR